MIPPNMTTNQLTFIDHFEDLDTLNHMLQEYGRQYPSTLL